MDQKLLIAIVLLLHASTTIGCVKFTASGRNTCEKGSKGNYLHLTLHDNAGPNDCNGHFMPTDGNRKRATAILVSFTLILLATTVTAMSTTYLVGASTALTQSMFLIQK
jgi:hypothetical protein